MKRRSQEKTTKSKNTYAKKVAGKNMMYGRNPHYRYAGQK